MILYIKPINATSEHKQRFRWALETFLEGSAKDVQTKIQRMANTCDNDEKFEKMCTKFTEELMTKYRKIVLCKLLPGLKRLKTYNIKSLDDARIKTAVEAQHSTSYYQTTKFRGIVCEKISAEELYKRFLTNYENMERNMRKKLKDTMTNGYKPSYRTQNIPTTPKTNRSKHEPRKSRTSNSAASPNADKKNSKEYYCTEIWRISKDCVHYADSNVDDKDMAKAIYRGLKKSWKAVCARRLKKNKELKEDLNEFCSRQYKRIAQKVKEQDQEAVTSVIKEIIEYGMAQ